MVDGSFGIPNLDTVLFFSIFFMCGDPRNPKLVTNHYLL